MLHLYNTLTRKKEAFHPRVEKQVKLFVCGPTVYDYIHIGNARTFVFFDVVAKYLCQSGYTVVYIQNITDIDDRIIARGQAENKDPLALGEEYAKIFQADVSALGITSPEYKSATDHVAEVVSQVKKLIAGNHAYLIEKDGWYFDLATFPEYGKLSGRKILSADDAVSRIDDNPNKRQPGDFCLWKLSKTGEPSWPDEQLGTGRPGWHIEDTAITEKYFGPQYDVHGGGQDLIFPHHEAEITQQESASGLKPFVKYWLHCAFLVNKTAKMSKSAGNFMTVRDALKNYSPATLRFYFLSAHYRSPLDAGEDVLKAAAAGVQRIGELIAKLSALKANPASYDAIGKLLSATKQEFATAMDDDFNTPQALAAIFKLIREVNTQMRDNRVSDAAAQEILALLANFNQILGIVPTNIETVPAEVSHLIETRELLRRDKRYSEADDVRAQITAKGYRLDDTSNGPLVTKI